MATRALIIAIEDYPDSQSTSTSLPGVLKDAERFVEWLTSSIKIDPRNIVFCCSARTASPDRFGAARSQIKNAVLRLLDAGRNDTETLFVFIAGHGVLKLRPDNETHTDVLLCSDFINSKVSGDACLQLDDLTRLLARELGPGSHFWFIDDCRTPDLMVIPSPLMAVEPVDTGTASWFQLLSTQEGSAAINDSRFLDALLVSLQDDSHVKGVDWITFNDVARRVASMMHSQYRTIDVRTSGSADSRIRQVRKPGQVPTIVTKQGLKSPPVELLKSNEQVLFLGETNWKLPSALSEAFEARNNRRWKQLDILTLEDLSQAHRAGIQLEDLTQQREAAEEFFRQHAAEMTEHLNLYRYNYVGMYGSFWTSEDGSRRAHVSVAIPGEDIQSTPASDYLDFPEARNDLVERLFQRACRTLTRQDCLRTFQHPAPSIG